MEFDGNCRSSFILNVCVTLALSILPPRSKGRETRMKKIVSVALSKQRKKKEKKKNIIIRRSYVQISEIRSKVKITMQEQYWILAYNNPPSLSICTFIFFPFSLTLLCVPHLYLTRHGLVTMAFVVGVFFFFVNGVAYIYCVLLSIEGPCSGSVFDSFIF